MKNRIGPSTEPCGTPEVTGTKSDSSPSSTTDCDRLPRKAWIQSSSLPLIPYRWSFQSSFEWLTLSNAFEKSNSIRSVCLPTHAFRARSSTSMVSCVSHWPFFSKTVLKIVKQVMFVHVPNHMWSHYTLKDLAQDTSEGDRSVLGSQWFVPWLYIGATNALHQSAGSLPDWRDRSNMICNIGAIFSHNSCSKRGFNLSGPVAFPGFRFFRSFRMPSTGILNSSIAGTERKTPGGTESGEMVLWSVISCSFIVQSRDKDNGALAVKTDWSCWFCLLAFQLVSVMRLSPCFSGDEPRWSWV